MIKQTSIFIAQPIAEELVANEKSLSGRVGKIVQGLDNESYPFIDYDLNTLPLTAPEVTASEGGHSLLIEEMSTGLAALVNNSFTNISNYLIPLSKKLIEATGKATDYESSVADMIFREVDIRYLKLDQPFFLSPFYPGEFVGNASDYARVNISDLRFPGQFSLDEPEKLNELVKISNADITAIINDCPPASLFERIAIRGGWSEMFGDAGGLVDFSKYEMKDPARLFSLYVLFSRMNASEEPIDGLSGIELSDYRNWVSYTLNCLTYALVQVRDRFKVYAGTNFPVMASDLKRSESTGGIKGTITIGVTAKSIEEYSADQTPVTISEAIIGRAMVQTLDLAVETNGFDLIVNKAVYGNVFKSFQDGLVARFSEKVKSQLTTNVTSAINAFQRDYPQFLPAINKNVESTETYNRLFIGVRSEVDQFVNQFIQACVVRDVKAEEFVMGSLLVPAIAKLIGLEMAADILRESNVSGVGGLSEVAQREMLSGAVARVLVEYVINK